MTPEAYLDRVRALLPVLRQRTAHAEQLRRLPDETFADFQEAGLFRALQPKRYGGYELDPGTLYQAVMEVGTVCGSSAWILGVIGVHNWHLAIFPAQAQEDVWGGDTSLQLSTSLAPTGTVERVDGGYRLRGRWSFSSGCDFCHWAVLGGIVPPAESGQALDARVFLVPHRDYDIDDNWHVTGLCGTGSKDLVVNDAFVPEYRTHTYLDAFHLRHPGTAVNDAPLYRLPFGIIFSNGIAAPAIGVALGALEAFREQSRARVNLRDQSRLVEDPFIQYRLAEAAAEVSAARDRLLDNFAVMMRLVRAGEEIPLSARARYRWDAGKAIDWSVRVRAGLKCRPRIYRPERAMREETIREVEQFLYREARLLDERRFHEWLELFTDDVRYWMAPRRNRYPKSSKAVAILDPDRYVDEDSTEEAELAILDENKQTLNARVARLGTGMAWAQDPPSRTRAVDRLFEASGGRGIFLNNPIQRAWRDVHAMRAHAGNNPERAAAVFGRSEFGLPPQDIRF